MSLRVIRNRERQKTRQQQQTSKQNQEIRVIKRDFTLKRYSKSCPDLRRIKEPVFVHTLSKSETDLKRLAAEIIVENGKQNFFVNAKSEVCLKTISVHAFAPSSSSTPHFYDSRGGAHPSRVSRGVGRADNRNFSSRRTMSEKSDLSSSVSNFSRDGPNYNNAVYGSVIQIPIVGYEVMEERARFTVFKLRVENPFTNDCWLVLRRYTDFHRLFTKLKTTFPKINLNIPKKKVFGDNFNNAFLDSRVQGLQQFVNAVMSNENLRSCSCVREFFCLDEPPTYSESMEECRAIFEAQEETITHLKHQLRNKDLLLVNMEQKLNASLKALQDHLAQCSMQQSPPTYNKLDITNNNIN